MIIQNIKESAEAVGINAFITNSRDKIETQLNRLTREEDLPIMLVSWDIRYTIDFNQSGWVNNPPVEVVALLMTKAEDKSKEEAENAAEEMGQLFIKFLQELHEKQRVLIKTNESPITGASYQLVPSQGASQHSGVLGRFTVKAEITNKCPV